MAERGRGRLRMHGAKRLENGNGTSSCQARTFPAYRANPAQSASRPGFFLWSCFVEQYVDAEVFVGYVHLRDNPRLVAPALPGVLSDTCVAGRTHQLVSSAAAGSDGHGVTIEILDRAGRATRAVRYVMSVNMAAASATLGYDLDYAPSAQRRIVTIRNISGLPRPDTRRTRPGVLGISADYIWLRCYFFCSRHGCSLASALFSHQHRCVCFEGKPCAACGLNLCGN